MTKKIVLLLAALGLLASGQMIVDADRVDDGLTATRAWVRAYLDSLTFPGASFGPTFGGIITNWPRARFRYAWSDTLRIDSAGRAYYWASDVDDSLIPSRNWCRNNAGVQAESVFTWSDADDTLGFLYCKNQKGYGYWLFFAPDTAGADALPAITSAGSGVFYSAKKCAFAGGYNRVGLWSQDSIGKHSFKFGVDCYALDTSVAFGRNCKATGPKSFAGGFISIASGDRAFVYGSQDSATGASSAVLGGNINAANGAEAFVGGGNDNTAHGARSAIIGGQGNVAAGFSSYALGQSAICNGDTSVHISLSGPGATLESTNVFAVTGGRVSFGSVTPSPTCQLHVQGIIDVTGDIRRKAEVNGADNVYCRELEIEDGGSVSEIVGPVGGDVGGSVTLFTVPDSCELVRCKVLVTTYDAQGEEANTSIAIGTTANADATIAGDEENLVIESNYFGASAPPCRTATGDQGALIYNAGDHLYPWQASGSTVYLNWAAQGSGMGGDVTFSVVAVISLIIQPMRTGSM